MWAELREGLAVVLGNPLLRSIAGCTATSNLFGNALQAVYVLYVTRELGIGPALLGLIFSVGGPGALLGSLLAGRVATRFGLGATIIGSMIVGDVANLLIPLAERPHGCRGRHAHGGLVRRRRDQSRLQHQPGQPASGNHPRPSAGPDERQRALSGVGTIPIGALMGGALGEALGLWPTIAAMAVCSMLAPLWVLFSPVRRCAPNPRRFDLPRERGNASVERRVRLVFYPSGASRRHGR